MRRVRPAFPGYPPGPRMRPPSGSPGGLPRSGLNRHWPRGRPRILVADAWLANGGDGAISIATDRLIRAAFPAAAVLHAAYQSDLVGHHYPELDLVPPLAGLLDVVWELPETRGWSIGDRVTLVEDADVVLSQGGGFLIEHYEPWQRLDAYERVVELGLPIGFLAQTIGRFEREDRRASLSRALVGAAAVSVRDRRSFDNVIELGVPADRVRLSADEAFSLFPREPSPGAHRGVTVVLSRDTLTGEEGFVADEPGLAQTLGEALRLVAEQIDPEEVTVCSTTQGLGPLDRGLEDDDLFADEVVASLPEGIRRRVRRVHGYLAPLACARLIARSRALVSMRMHPMIFGLSQGVPTVAITKAHKAVDLLGDLGMEELRPAWLDPQAIAEATRRALAPDTPRGVDLWARLDPQRRRAGLNREALAELVAAAERRP